jgi:hypothetical protein
VGLVRRWGVWTVLSWDLDGGTVRAGVDLHVLRVVGGGVARDLWGTDGE